jgi:transposase-like protein
MGKQRRKFETGFKQQIIQEVESGLLSVGAASRKYQIAGSVIDRWRRQARQGGRRLKRSCELSKGSMVGDILNLRT